MGLSKKITTNTADIWMDDEGIVHLRMKKGAKVDLREIEAHYNIYRKLGCQKHKTLHLFEGGYFFTFDNEAMRYAGKHSRNLFLASAIVNNSLAVRLLVDFFNLFFNNSFTFKMFNTKGQALEWLRSFKEKEKS